MHLKYVVKFIYWYKTNARAGIKDASKLLVQKITIT